MSIYSFHSFSSWSWRFADFFFIKIRGKLMSYCQFSSHLHSCSLKFTHSIVLNVIATAQQQNRTSLRKIYWHLGNCMRLNLCETRSVLYPGDILSLHFLFPWPKAMCPLVKKKQKKAEVSIFFNLEPRADLLTWRKRSSFSVNISCVKSVRCSG